MDLDRDFVIVVVIIVLIFSMVFLVSVLRDDNDIENSSDGNGNNSKIGGVKDKVDSGVIDFKFLFCFWVIFIMCVIIVFFSVLENIVIIMVLFYIVIELEIGENYVWIINVFFFIGYVL